MYPGVRRWLIERASLEPTLLEGPAFESLVAERLGATGASSEAEYVAALERSPEETDRLAAGVAVSETWFFRYPRSFEVLAEELGRRRAAGAEGVRLLSVGCATGEEPFSMAMVALHAGWPPNAIRIEALDRNPRALRKAAEGRYGAASFRGETPAWAMEFLQREGEEARVAQSVRDLVTFRRADALEPGAIGASQAYDAVFCRNLFIYIGEAGRSRLIRSLEQALAPGGLLFVGHAEPLLCASPTLQPCSAAHAFALRATEARPPQRHVGEEARRPPSAVAPAFPARSLRRAPPAARPAASAPVVGETMSIESARDLADAGRAAESEAAVRAILAKRGPSADALELLGMIRLARNDANEAKRCFEQAVYLQPARAASLLQLAMLSEKHGDASRAESYWNRARRATDATKAPAR